MQHCILVHRAQAHFPAREHTPYPGITQGQAVVWAQLAMTAWLLALGCSSNICGCPNVLSWQACLPSLSGCFLTHMWSSGSSCMRLNTPQHRTTKAIGLRHTRCVLPCKAEALFFTRLLSIVYQNSRRCRLRYLSAHCASCCDCRLVAGCSRQTSPLLTSWHTSMRWSTAQGWGL